MSSSTVTDPYIAESWIHMQQGHGSLHTKPKIQSLTDKTTRRPSKVMEGRFAKSTASSRSRASTAAGNDLKADLGMSRDGIFEAFAEVEKLNPTTWTETRRPSTAARKVAPIETKQPTTTRRKSTANSALEATIKIRRKSRSQLDDNEITTPRSAAPSRTRAGTLAQAAISSRRHSETKSPVASPRVRALTTKKSNESIQLKSPALKASIARRRPSTGSVLTQEQLDSPKLKAKIAQRSELIKNYELTHEKMASDKREHAPTAERDSRAHRRSILDDESICDTTDISARSRPKSIRTTTGPQEHGFIPIADAWRDSLAQEQTLAKKELGLHSDKAVGPHGQQRGKSRVLNSPPPTQIIDNNTNEHDEKETTSIHARRKSLHQVTDQRRDDPSQRSAAEIISHAKRRLSMSKEKAKELETVNREPRRRTLSSGSTLRPNIDSDRNPRRKSVVGTVHVTTTNNGAQGYMRPTMAEQRRRSIVPSPARALSSRAKTDASEEDGDSPVSPSVSRRRKSKAYSPAGGNNGESGTLGSSHSDEHVKRLLQRRMSKGSGEISPATASSAEDPGEEITLRSRKKSVTERPSALALSRRMSRTESLKEGVPTSPSLHAATRVRKKSLASQDTSVLGSIKRVSSKQAAGTTAKQAPPVRKRSKTLPGSLAKPPVVQSVQLPPMKMEPIKLSVPKTATKKTPKSPATRAVTTTPSRTAAVSAKSTSARSTTHEETTPATSGTSSDEEANTKGSTLKSRRSKGYSHLGMTSERRASLKTPRITPASPKGLTPVSANASPKTQPISTRRQSAHSGDGTKPSARKLSVSVGTKTVADDLLKTPDAVYSPAMGPTSAGGPRTRKTSFTGTGSMSRANSKYPMSRKDSFASSAEQENTNEKDKDRHRAMSLHERLQAMVAQHAIKEDYNTNSDQYAFLRDRKARRSLGYEPDEKYEQWISAEDRAHSKRISDPFMYEKQIAPESMGAEPKSPQMALKCYAPYLSLFERVEIRDYPEVYFVGPDAPKYQASHDYPTCNYGYDDERGDYRIVVQDHLAYRYEVLEELGRGSFGQVVKCYDHKTGLTVAIKLIRNKKRFHAQALTEVKILKNLVDWDPEDKHHNIKMTDYFYFRNHLCIACECLSMNLYEFIKSHNFKGFNVTLIKRFTLQLLQSLSLLYEHGVVHCDLKPENILLKHPLKSTIKVIDFGSSCLENERVYTYIQSRFYRSPEIILGMNYNMAIDMWSLGCILGELYTGLPLFPGENEQEQLACIMEIMGVPDQYLIERSSRKKLFFDSNDNPRIFTNSRGKKRRPGSKTLAHALRCNDTLFLDFIERCLEWDPERRITPAEALQHEWIVQNSKHSSKPAPGNTPIRRPSCTTNVDAATRAVSPNAMIPKTGATGYYYSLRKNSFLNEIDDKYARRQQ
ncbi:hypothetical protein EC973_001627 [Apophysomyces ossiformis]|uniref:dual-specificity kinase n=1 Tax=Apophysomyces ossiformis TaxID=679940 RepID=A0A8H7BWL1_9FUNG|nr:hypothetical protein EC973_001627 [Apophysomyces ossiformis]